MIASQSLIHFLEAILDQVGGCFFAADPPGAKHGDFLFLVGEMAFLHVFVPFSKGFRLWVDGSPEGSDGPSVLSGMCVHMLCASAGHVRAYVIRPCRGLFVHPGRTLAHLAVQGCGFSDHVLMVDV